LAVGIPLILGASVALVWLEPLFAVALLIPLGGLLVTMATLSPLAYQRARTLRRHRGKLSSHVADTILSASAIRTAGGAERELRRIESLSGSLVEAAIHRARIGGALRGAAAMASGVASAMVVGIGLMSGLQTHAIAGALAIVGFLATPIHDLGRVAEYRQSYRAARRIIGPAMALPAGPSLRRASRSAPVDGSTAGVTTTAIELSNGLTMPGLRALPGDRIVVDAGDERMTSEVLARLVGLQAPDPGQVQVDGHDLSAVDPKLLRGLVGYAAQGTMLVRGTVSRTVRNRCPAAAPAEVDRLLALVELAPQIAELPQGIGTTLVHGGEPLTIPERARLLLAQAILEDPPALILDHLDADLGKEGRAMMRSVLRDYPGVVMLASDQPTLVLEPTRVWRPTEIRAQGQLVGQVADRFGGTAE
jgi:ABC-type multidrug transport system fused ATPase/permease subunit